MSKNGKTLSGVHVAHFKNTEELSPVKMPVPAKVYISMKQHMGAPCKPLVAKGDVVKVGQLIGSSDAFMSAPIHSSISGTVAGLEQIVNNVGGRDDVVIIESDGAFTMDESIQPPVVTNKDEFVAAIKNSGLVGLGGAGFPAHIKFNPQNLDEVDTLIINAAECEPFITSDYHTMLDSADDIIAGIQLVQKYLNIKTVVIGIEANKPKAIALMQEKTAKDASISVHTLDAKYPKGAEKVIIYETTGRVVPEGKLPMHVGVIVSNVGSIAFVGQYFRTGIPLISKSITVDGSAIAKPQNVIAPIGTTYKDIVEFCGGFSGEPYKLLMGGPMMGIALYSADYPLLKNNNALIAFGEKEAQMQKETACIRCNRCVYACPMGLMPASIERAYDAGNKEELKALKVNLCMDCGCCAYSCPAKRHLVLTNKMAKNLIAEKK